MVHQMPMMIGGLDPRTHQIPMVIWGKGGLDPRMHQAQMMIGGLDPRAHQIPIVTGGLDYCRKWHGDGGGTKERYYFIFIDFHRSVSYVAFLVCFSTLFDQYCSIH